jgi:hypothetical protein
VEKTYKGTTTTDNVVFTSRCLDDKVFPSIILLLKSYYILFEGVKKEIVSGDLLTRKRYGPL